MPVLMELPHDRCLALRHEDAPAQVSARANVAPGDQEEGNAGQELPEREITDHALSCW